MVLFSWHTPSGCFVFRISFVISFNVYHRPLYYAYGNIIDIGPRNCPACLPGASPQAFWSLKCLDQLNFFLQIFRFVFNISNILYVYLLFRFVFYISIILYILNAWTTSLRNFFANIFFPKIVTNYKS